VVILSGGHIVAEHGMASFRDARSRSLEQVFVQVTGQQDFTPIAREILEAMKVT
jgi:hypothetical protein